MRELSLEIAALPQHERDSDRTPVCTPFERGSRPDRGRQLENLSFVYFLLWLILFRGAAFRHVSLVRSGRRFAIFLREMLRSDRLRVQEGLGGEFTSPVVAPERLFTSLRRYSK